MVEFSIIFSGIKIFLFEFIFSFEVETSLLDLKMRNVCPLLLLFLLFGFWIDHLLGFTIKSFFSTLSRIKTHKFYILWIYLCFHLLSVSKTSFLNVTVGWLLYAAYCWQYLTLMCYVLIGANLLPIVIWDPQLCWGLIGLRRISLSLYKHLQPLKFFMSTFCNWDTELFWHLIKQGSENTS